ncbi:MAG: FAD-binding oxidoreductase, partial [Woeseia sp.]
MITERLKQIVGEKGWISAAEELAPYLQEWRGSWHGATPVMLMPENTEQVSRILAECNASGTAVVPQGGNTGLCGGAIPDASGTQVLLSLRRMNRVRSISAENYSMVAEAGCVLADLQRAADDIDRTFALSLAAEGSCQIGGNLSTDAGGVNVLRYGTAREQALGLEVVLADGTVLNSLRTLRKDTAGYDLKQLFIGAEGTLGVITAASLRLFPKVRQRGTALLALSSAEQSVALLAELRGRLHDQLLAFELISAPAAGLAEK